MSGIAGPSRWQTVRAETSRWLWEPSEESSPPSVSQQLPVPPQPLGQTSLGGTSGARLGRGRVPACPSLWPQWDVPMSCSLPWFPGTGTRETSGLVYRMRWARAWGGPPARASPLERSGPPVLRLPGGGHHSPPGLGGPSGRALEFAGTAGCMVVMAVSDRTSSRGVWAPRLALGLPRRPLVPVSQGPVVTWQDRPAAGWGRGLQAPAGGL